MSNIPYSRQDISEADIQAVVDVLRSDYLTQGPAVPAFETAIKEYCNATYAIATNSATSSLHIACLALGVGSGDIVWTSPITFVASSNCALYCGASIDFVDIDIDTYNMSINVLEQKLVHAEKSGQLPKVIIPVHLCGQPCEMEKIHTLSKKYGFKIIEDASHAIGAKYKNEPIGNCKFSDITIFSFHPVKIITTGEGGMATTNCPQLANKMQLLRTHGITRDENLMTKSSDGPWYYEQIDLGFNYRMSDIQAALGLSQFNRLDAFVSKRHEIAKRYNDLFEPIFFSTQTNIEDAYSAFHLYVIRLSEKNIKKNHLEVFKALKAANIDVNLHYIPVYLQPYYQQLGFEQGYCQEAENYYKSAISLPIYPSLIQSQQDFVINSIKELCFD